MSTDDTPPPGPGHDRWRPTHAHLRACVLAASLVVLAVLSQHASLVVLAGPFLAVVAWSLLTVPRESPTLRHPVRLPVLREGESMSWRAELSAVEGLDQAALLFAGAAYLELRPGNGTIGVTAPARPDGPLALTVQARSTRWGNRPAGAAVISATSSWAAFRWGPIELEPLPQTTLPLPAVFDSAAPPPHPVGLVGLNRSARRGDGTEFATIRAFQSGDRLRRLHWPVSLRTGELHVTATWADQDAEVLLLVDASTDLGSSEGVDGLASSLDVTVRAAGAVAEHFLHRGDRVGMCVFGPSVVRVPTGSGQTHLRRLLFRLADTMVGDRDAATARLLRLHLNGDAMVVMLSACISPVALTQAAALAARGLSAVVVDTLPEHVGGVSGPALTTAWRIRRLERSAELLRLTRHGIPVVPWHGPGSLDQVLRDLGRRSRAPRLSRR